MQNKKSFIFKVLFFLFSASFLIFASCSNSLEDRRNSDSKYGNLIYSSAAKALDVSSIVNAKVTVTGNGITSEISSTCSIDSGTGSVRIEKIPVGKNRIISVFALDSSGNYIEEGVLRAVTDINPGENTIDVINKSTSCVGNVYNELFESGIEISNLTDSEISALSSVIPTLEDCGNDLSRLDSESIAQDFISGRESGTFFVGKTKSDYVFPLETYLVKVRIAETSDSTEENPAFAATAYYSDDTTLDITTDATWTSSDTSVATVENGEITLLAEGTTSVYVEYKYDNITRTSPKANFTVTKETASGNKVYLDNSGSVNYAKDSAVVAAWVWGTNLSSKWIKAEKVDSKYMYVELPTGAEKIIFARGKYLDNSNLSDWDSIYSDNSKGPWNKTADLTIPTLTTSNTFKPSSWAGATGNWDYVDHGDVLEDRIYASIQMEASEDDTTLSSVTVNGSSLTLSKRMTYTVPYDVSEITLVVTPNYSGATVDVSPSLTQTISNPGDSVQFKITVIAKDGTNTDSYIVKVYRSSSEPLNSDENKQKCYIDNTEDQTITFACSPDIWTSVTSADTITICGSFTQIFNESTKKWVEDTDSFTLTYDNIYKWFTITLPYEKVKRPGYNSGQPEYRFYKNGKELEIPSTVNSDYIFGGSGDIELDEKLLIFFESDDETRRAEVLANSAEAIEVAESSEFDLTTDAGKRAVSNFRQVPGTTNLYRSYHPFYPTHEYSPLEQNRLELVQSYAVAAGIASDINLCNNRTYKVENSYTVVSSVGNTEGTSYTVTIPEYYQTIIDNNNVLYVGDTTADSSANGIVPSAKHVYYNSNSTIFAQWIKQTCDFINSHSAPFQIHCEIGIDRTGVFCAVFAGLCGATWDEIKADYTESNNMKIGEFRDWRVLKYSLENMLGVSDIENVSDLATELKNYFVNTGIVSESDITSVVEKLK